MKIGITERGDAGIDFSWHQNLSTVDGAIIITKKMSDRFNELMLSASKPVILHCDCTGWGGTWLEPNIHDYKTQLAYLKKLIDAGFPSNRIVLRIDPIIPTEEGIRRACDVLDYVISENIPISRIRCSIYDEYNHVKDRLRAIGKEPFYNGTFYAPLSMMDDVITAFSNYPFTFETCAEDMVAARSDKFIAVGCVSLTDFNLMGLEPPTSMHENGQNRRGCHCLTNKTELLSRRAQCPNGCLYCYWKPSITS